MDMDVSDVDDTCDLSDEPCGFGLDGTYDDTLVLILAAIPADDARSAFCVNQRFASKAAAAREKRLRLFWRALFKSEIGFPDVSLLTAADAVRFEVRLSNSQHARGWKCLSCLRPSPMQFGEFCLDCVANEKAFVAGTDSSTYC